MPTRRRRFLKASVLGLAGAAVAPAAGAPQPPQTPPGMPPAFGTGPGAGPPVTPATFAEAEKLVQVQYTPAQRALQFARSAPGMGTALVGMKTSAHVDENALVARIEPIEG